MGKSSPTSGSRARRGRTMSRIGKLPIPVPSGVDVAIEGQTVTVKGPRGTLSHVVSEPIEVQQVDDGTLEVRRPDDERQSKALHGLSRTLIANMVTGRDGRLREAPGDRRSRLPRRTRGDRQRWSSRSATATRSRSTPPRASRSRSRPRPASRCRASTSRRSARWRQTFASSASLSPTRARASGTPASRSAARSERLVSNGYRAEARQAHGCQDHLTGAQAKARAQEDPRLGRTAASGGHPLEPPRVRPGR